MHSLPRHCCRPLACLVAGILLIAGGPRAIGLAADGPPSTSARQAAAEVLSLLTSPDGDLRGVALDRVRHGLWGSWFTTELVAELPRLPASQQVALLAALAERGDPAALPTGRQLAAAGSAEIRAAAVGLLCRLGGGSEISLLVDSLGAENEVSAAGYRALRDIQGTGAAVALRAAAAAAAPPLQAQLIDILADRRDRAALPIFEAALAGDPVARSAAVRALGRLGGPEQIDPLVRGFVQAAPDERKATEQAIVAVCTTGGTASAAADALTKAFVAAGPTVQDDLLPVLARIGGPSVLSIIDQLLSEPASRQRGLAALSRWPDASVKNRLLAIHAETIDPLEKQLLLDALIRIAPAPDNKLDDAGRLELVRQTFALCASDADRERLLERTNAIRTFAAFQFVAAYLDDPTLAEAACRSVVELAHHRQLRDAHREEFTAALDKVLSITKNPELVERATRYKAGKTWDRKQKS
jgi:HEAT repeat protein